jgi:hypothetical protein
VGVVCGSGRQAEVWWTIRQATGVGRSTDAAQRREQEAPGGTATVCGSGRQAEVWWTIRQATGVGRSTGAARRREQEAPGGTATGAASCGTSPGAERGIGAETELPVLPETEMER